MLLTFGERYGNLRSWRLQRAGQLVIWKEALCSACCVLISPKLKRFEEVKGLVKVVKKVSRSTTRTSLLEPGWWVTSSRDFPISLNNTHDGWPQEELEAGGDTVQIFISLCRYLLTLLDFWKLGILTGDTEVQFNLKMNSYNRADLRLGEVLLTVRVLMRKVRSTKCVLRIINPLWCCQTSFIPRLYIRRRDIYPIFSKLPLRKCTYFIVIVLRRLSVLQQPRGGRDQRHSWMRLIVKLWFNFHFFPWTVDPVFHELALYVLIYSLSCIVIRILDQNCCPLCQMFPQKCTYKVTNDCTVESQLLCSFSSGDLDTRVLPGLINSSIHVVGLNGLY